MSLPKHSLTIEALTKRKFNSLERSLRHKKCAAFLRICYEALLSNRPFSLAPYQHLLEWTDWPSLISPSIKEIAERYHWHLHEAGKSLKEHNLLPSLRTGDRTPKADYLPIDIYLDHVRSAYNVGSILRTCEALRLGSVHFSKDTPFLDNEKVSKTAMGTSPLVPCFAKATLSELRRPIIVLDTSDEAIPISEYLFPPSFTLVLGNEEVGVSDQTLSFADQLLEIPLLGAKNSINVACAFAIAAAQIRHQFSAL